MSIDPFCLCEYEIIVKLLSNRLKNVFHKVLVVNEMIRKGVLIKVDFEKTYDWVKYDFILYMMKRLGWVSIFVDKWTKRTNGAI